VGASIERSVLHGLGAICEYIIIKRNIYDIEISFSPEIMIDKKLMSENWNKFLTAMRKIKSY